MSLARTLVLASVGAALLAACGNKSTSNDAGTVADAGVHDAGIPDAGTPGAFAAINVHDGGTFTFPLVSATVIYGIHPDGGFNPATAVVLVSSLTREELCGLSLSLPFGTLETETLTHEAALLFAEFSLFPDAGVAWVPGSYVSPDAGVGVVALGFTTDGGSSDALTGFSGASTETPFRVNVSAADVSTASGDAGDGGHLYSGGRFAAAIHYRQTDGGAPFDLDFDARGCDGQSLIHSGF